MSSLVVDDLKYIHTKDTQDAFGFVAKQPRQLTVPFSVPKLDLEHGKSIQNIVFAGMGGSSLSGLFALSWPGCNVPFEIWRRYDTPSYLGKQSLLIICSYSGSTEESLSAFDAGLMAGAHIVVLARGGKLADKAQAHSAVFLQLPDTPHPRYGTFSAYRAVVELLQSNDLTFEKNCVIQFESAATFLEQAAQQWGVDVPAKENPAKQLSLELAGTTPIIYAGEKMQPAAYKWKLAFNENAKNLAWYGEVPEFSHNEFSGWTSHPVEKAFSVIDLRSHFEHPRVQKRLELSERLLSGKRPHPHLVVAKGEDTLQHLLYLSLFGDFVSLYMAILNGVDPTPLPYVGKLKSALGDS